MSDSRRPNIWVRQLTSGSRRSEPSHDEAPGETLFGAKLRRGLVEAALVEGDVGPAVGLDDLAKPAGPGAFPGELRHPELRDPDLGVDAVHAQQHQPRVVDATGQPGGDLGR